ncbi:hypothetical protein EDC01DRAFT_781542 [Geopyxis carbonaria]|nr:hypothetical protein EDC01DRAFT_781542 [Geopyxis carbonaria]
MDDLEVAVTSNALDELTLGSIQSLATQVPQVTAASNAKFETAGSTLQEIKKSAEIKDREERQKNQYVGVSYIAPNKLNAAKRRRYPAPEVSLKRIRHDKDGESSPMASRKSKLKSTENQHQDISVRATLPAGKTPLDFIIIEDIHLKGATDARHQVEGSIKQPGSLDYLAPIDNEELLRETAALRLENAKILAKNTSLRTERVDMNCTIRVLTEALIAAERKIEELKTEIPVGEQKQKLKEGLN